MYKCICGKEFDNSQRFNGHKTHCKVHQIEKYGKEHYEKNLTLQMSSQKKMTANHIEKSKYRNEEKEKKWILEQHVCEKCGKIMTKKFGSGRFCSRFCANSRQLSYETKTKISKKLRNDTQLEKRFCKNCGIEIKLKNKTGYCMHCIHSADELHEKRSCSAKKAGETRKRNGTQSSWISRSIQSYPEKFWTQVLNNNNVVYDGPNVPIRKTKNSFYFLDFLIHTKTKKIDLEIDGKQHTYPERKLSDIERDKYLKSLGYLVYRISWNEVKSEAGKLKMKEKIDKFLEILD